MGFKGNFNGGKINFDQFSLKLPFSSISEMVKMYYWKCVKPSRGTPMMAYMSKNLLDHIKIIFRHDIQN